jgi:L,D-transpeptidase YcbB
MKFSLTLGAVALSFTAPLHAVPRGDEPVAVPRTVKQGIDFIYVDPALESIAPRRQRPTNWLLRTIGLDWGPRAEAPNPIFIDLARGLQHYQTTWARLPQVKVPAGPTLKGRLDGTASGNPSRAARASAEPAASTAGSKRR